MVQLRPCREEQAVRQGVSPNHNSYIYSPKMEDRHIAAHDLTLWKEASPEPAEVGNETDPAALFCVFDGHGGSEVGSLTISCYSAERHLSSHRFYRKNGSFFYFVILRWLRTLLVTCHPYFSRLADVRMTRR